MAYSLTPDSTTRTEDNTSVTFTVTRSGSFPAETIYASTLSDTASSAAGDYTGLVNQPLVFSSGQTTATFSVNLLEDSAVESTEHFRVMIAKNQTDGSAQALDISDIFITDDDTVATTYNLTPDSTTQTEANTSITFTITRSGSFPAETIYASTLFDTASSPGDYTGIVDQAVVFSSGQQTATFTVSLKDDTLVESTEHFRVMIAKSQGQGSAQALDISDINITDNDTAIADDYADDASDTTASIGIVSVGSSLTGFIGPADSNDSYGDKDVFKVSLSRGQTYEIRMQSTSINGQSLPLDIFTIRAGNNFDNVLATSSIGANVATTLTADTDGFYYVRAGTGGAATDQGGYRLSVTNVTPTSTSDDFSDVPGDTTANQGVGTISLGSSRTGIIEAAGDKDVFKVPLTANHTYQFSVTGEQVADSNTALRNIYMTLRDGNNFDSVLEQGGNTFQASFSFLAQQSGDKYIRIGGSGDGSSTGGYRILVTDSGVTTPLVEPPSSGTPPDQAVEQWLDNRFRELATLTFTNFFNEDTWDLFKALAQTMNDTQAAKVAEHIHNGLSAFHLGFDIGTIIVDVAHARDPVQTLVIDVGNYFAEMLVVRTAGGLGGFVGGSLSGPFVILGSALGNVIGGVLGSWGYDKYLEAHVEQYLDLWWDGVDDPEWGPTASASQSSIAETVRAAAAGASAASASDLDEARLIRFDENYYLATYPDAAAAVMSRTAASAYAHFLTIGIDKGYQPNATQHITRADLADSVLNNNPLALNHITGDARDTQLFGGAGNDTLNGGPGNDTLTGGPGDDRFAYTPGGGADIFTDLVAGGSVDKIDLTAFAKIHTLGDVLARATPNGANTVIDFGGGDTITLQNIAKTALRYDDFVLTPAAAVALADFGGDARKDILWRDDHGTVALWQMNGTQIVGNNAVVTIASNWHIVGTGDFGGDNRGDILWRADDGTVALWEMNGAQIVGNNAVARIASDWHIVATGDFNGDRKADILWRADDSTVALWEMNGAQIVGNNAVARILSDWHIVATDDFDGDHKTDILWRADDGTVALWQMDGAQIAGNNAVAKIANNWHIERTGDFGGDGRADILWRADDGTVALWQMDGAQIVGNNGIATIANNWHISNVGDLSGDNRADVLWRADDGTVALWEMNGAQIAANNALITIANDWHILG
jgi:Calx-beta domain-containing protein/hemolysin type calcium-binding protein/VCBS repeat protein